MGQPKQLMPYRGRPLVEHSVRAALDSCCRPVLVVTGASAEGVAGALHGVDARVIYNPRWNEGVGTSIQAGVRAAQSLDVEALILALADQPLLTGAIYDRLLGEYRRNGQAIVASEYSATVGVPVLFHRQLFPQLLALGPDRGCKGVILGNRDQAALIPCVEAEADIDTIDDYRRLGGEGGVQG